MKSINSQRLYIWQHEDWPNFKWDSELLIEPLSKLSALQGQLNGKMAMLGFNKETQTILSVMTDDLVGSSEIEGVTLDAKSVRSSISRKLGLEEGIIIEDRYVDGLVEVMLDSTHCCRQPLTAERLFGWHAALFPTGRSGMYKITVGDWRKGEEPMQVVSGAMGHEKVHFEAMPSSLVADEMQRFIQWCNTASFPAVIMSAVAHLWFVTIHPFDDGNGRVGRTIADLFLSRWNDNNVKYYSVSAEIRRNKKAYYDILEKAQKGSMDVTAWLLWYIDSLEKAVIRANEMVEVTVRKANYWDKFSGVSINERQRKVINRLWDGFEGKLTSSKWAKICHCSHDTALRDIKDLIDKKMLERCNEGGRSTSYTLPKDK